MWSKKTHTRIVCICLLILAITTAAPVSDNAEALVIEVGPGMEYETISEAIEAASEGDTVMIYGGVYSECVTVDKSIDIHVHDEDEVILDGGGEDGFFLTAKNIRLTGMNITNCSTGIIVYETSGVRIEDISMGDVNEGLLIWYSQDIHISNTTVVEPSSNGFRSINSSNQLIVNCTVTDHGYYPAYISRSSNVTFDGCDFIDGERGAYLYYSEDVKLENNHISRGMSIDGDSPNYFDTHTINNNTVKHGGLMYLKDTSAEDIVNYKGQLILVNVTESTIFNTSTIDLDAGILLAYCDDNRIIGNTVKDNFQGMVFHRSRVNHIHHNNFINNTRQIYSQNHSSQDNIWNDSLGGGNYWSDYGGTDEKGDLVGDNEIPHPVDDRGGGYYQLDPEPLINIASTVNHSISLSAGWNFISIGLVTPTENLPDILSSIDGSYDRVFRWDAGFQSWSSYVPGRAKHFNALNGIERGNGLWIHVTEPGNLTLQGVTPAKTVITIHNGWNMIGIPSKGILSGTEVPEEVKTVGRFNVSREYLLEYLNASEIDYKPNDGYLVRSESNQTIIWNIVWEKP